MRRSAAEQPIFAPPLWRAGLERPLAGVVVDRLEALRSIPGERGLKNTLLTRGLARLPDTHLGVRICNGIAGN